MTRPAWIAPLALAVVVAGCGGSSGGSGSEGGSDSGDTTVAYTKATNEAAGQVASINDDIAATATGDQADSPAAWNALAARVDAVARRLKGTQPPTAESRAPLAALAADVAELGADVRAVAEAGGTRAAGGPALDALTSDGEAIQADLQKLPLY